MGARTFLVEGVSGSGKTSVADELERRGHRVVHGDRQLGHVGDPVTGAPRAAPVFNDDDHRAAWVHRHLCWPVDAVERIVRDDHRGPTCLCGGCRNAGQFRHLLDGVFVLHVDRETLVRRLDERPEDEWAGRGREAERDLVLRLHAPRRTSRKASASTPPGRCVTSWTTSSTTAARSTTDNPVAQR